MFYVNLRNIHIFFRWNKDSQTTKLTTTEYLSLYLKVHAYLYTCRELEACVSYIKILTDTLTPHIATQSFNSWKLVQVCATNLGLIGCS